MANTQEWTWKYFTRQEMQCRCGCGKAEMNPEFMDRLEDLRKSFGKPMVVSSGYRCAAHNHSVSHTGTAGPHTTGCAVDIRIGGAEAFELLRLATIQGFSGVGVSQAGDAGNRFLHLDILTAPRFPRPRVWSY